MISPFGGVVVHRAGPFRGEAGDVVVTGSGRPVVQVSRRAPDGQHPSGGIMRLSVAKTADDVSRPSAGGNRFDTIAPGADLRRAAREGSFRSLVPTTR